MSRTLQQALAVCPEEVRRAVETLPEKQVLEELRFRVGRPVSYLARGRMGSLSCGTVTAAMLEDLVARGTGQAVYAADKTLKQGFLPLPGGHRLGICGMGVYKQGVLTGLREFSSANLRIARAVPGAADGIMGLLWTQPYSVLLLGPPGRGKTTLLRDLICQASQRFGWRICVVDERMELGAALGGVAQFDLGPQTDLLSGVEKAEGISMVQRTMNPQWIAVDEITQEADVEAICRASYTGVAFFATAHAACRAELARRPVYRALLASGVFENLVTILPDRKLHWERLGAE